jgi:hypothetical protein
MAHPRVRPNPSYSAELTQPSTSSPLLLQVPYDLYFTINRCFGAGDDDKSEVKLQGEALQEYIYKIEREAR